MMPRTWPGRRGIRPKMRRTGSKEPLPPGRPVTLPTVSRPSAVSRAARGRGRARGRDAGRQPPPPPPPPLRGLLAAACASTGRRWTAGTPRTSRPAPLARRIASSCATKWAGARRTSSASRRTGAASSSLASLRPHPRPPLRPHPRLLHPRLHVWTRVPPTARAPMSSPPTYARVPPRCSAAPVRWCAVPVALAAACAASPRGRPRPHRPPHRHRHRRRRRRHRAPRHHRPPLPPRTLRPARTRARWTARATASPPCSAHMSSRRSARRAAWCAARAVPAVTSASPSHPRRHSLRRRRHSLPWTPSPSA